MARIRTIKPEFPQSETIGKLSRDARLLFIQLWTIADDSGRTRAASRMLASLLYPYDDDAPALIDGWLAELEQCGCLKRYVVGGSQYLEICNWLKHQKIDKPTASKIPAYSDEFANPRESSRILAPDLGPRTSIKDLGDTSLRSVARASAPDATPKEKKPKATRIPDDWQPNAVNEADALAAGIPPWKVKATGDKFRDYWRGKPGQGGLKLDWDATWRNWCRTEADRQGWHAKPDTGGPPAETKRDGVFVEQDSPEWGAWALHYRQQGRVMVPALHKLNGRQGAYLPTATPILAAKLSEYANAGEAA